MVLLGILGMVLNSYMSIYETLCLKLLPILFTFFFGRSTFVCTFSSHLNDFLGFPIFCLFMYVLYILGLTLLGMDV